MDWKALVKDIGAAGHSQAWIAHELGNSQSWVADILRGRYDDIKWRDGQKLIRLHRRVARKASKEAT